MPWTDHLSLCMLSSVVETTTRDNLSMCLRSQLTASAFRGQTPHQAQLCTMFPSVAPSHYAVYYTRLSCECKLSIYETLSCWMYIFFLCNEKWRLPEEKYENRLLTSVESDVYNFSTLTRMHMLCGKAVQSCVQPRRTRHFQNLQAKSKLI